MESHRAYKSAHLAMRKEKAILPMKQTSDLPNQWWSFEGPEGNTTEIGISVSSLLLHYQKLFPFCSTFKFYFLLGLLSVTLNITP